VEGLDVAAEERVLGRLGELRETLAGRRVTPKDGRGEKPVDYKALRQRIEVRRARAVSAFTDGTITASELSAQRARLDAEVEVLRRGEDAAGRQARAADPVARGDLGRRLDDLQQAWRKLDTEKRRAVVRLLAEGVELTKAGRLRWTWRAVADLVPPK
jgi:hypothetical protein